MPWPDRRPGRPLSLRTHRVTSSPPPAPPHHQHSSAELLRQVLAVVPRSKFHVPRHMPTSSPRGSIVEPVAQRHYIPAHTSILRLLIVLPAKRHAPIYAPVSCRHGCVCMCGSDAQFVSEEDNKRVMITMGKSLRDGRGQDPEVACLPHRVASCEHVLPR